MLRKHGFCALAGLLLAGCYLLLPPAAANAAPADNDGKLGADWGLHAVRYAVSVPHHSMICCLLPLPTCRVHHAQPTAGSPRDGPCLVCQLGRVGARQ